MMRVRGAPLICCVAAIGWGAPAHGAGLSVARFGGEHGHPMTSNPTAIFYNPSGIADGEGARVYGDLALALRHGTYERPASDTPVPAGAEGANSGSASLTNLVLEPFVGATYNIGSLGLGAAFSVPYGGQNSWDENERFRGSDSFPGAVDGVQRWYAIEGELRSHFFSLAAAYRLGPLRFGLSANVVQTLVSTVQARNASGSDDVRTEGRAWLDVESWDVSMGAGLTYEPRRDLRLGLSYQSRPGFGGGIRAEGDLRTVFGGRPATSKVAFSTDLPDVVRGGAAYRPAENVELRLFGDYQRWSVLERQCVMQEDSECNLAPDGSARPGNVVIVNTERRWNDTFGVRAGASYFTTPEIELIVGAGFASNAIPDETLDPALLDSEAITLALGVVGEVVRDLRLGATYTHVFYLPRDTTGESIHSTLAAPSASPDSGGKYTLTVGLLNLNVDLSF